MKPYNDYFEVSHQLVLADTETEINIRPLDGHTKFKSGVKYTVSYFPMEVINIKSGWTWDKQSVPFAIEDGVMKFKLFFEGEQEHRIRIEEVQETQKILIGEIRIYSLLPDLYERSFYKGDTHVHTFHSDGRESPAFVAAKYREAGFDFIAITDHHRYKPSLEAIDTYKDLPHDLVIFPGEEVHPENVLIHTVNFGGNFSVNERMKDTAVYESEVAAYEKELGPTPPGVDRHELAIMTWVYDQIRKGEGLAILPHPYWPNMYRYSPTTPMLNYLFETQPFDALELIGGFHKWEIESNNLQVARYYEEYSKGRVIPIVGASDSHGVTKGELFDWYYTLVFSPSLEKKDLIGSIKDRYSVAVEHVEGEHSRVWGPFRMVKYAAFLLREILPTQKRLCKEEGRLMLEYSRGDQSAVESLSRLNGRVKTYKQKVKGK